MTLTNSKGDCFLQNLVEGAPGRCRGDRSRPVSGLRPSAHWLCCSSWKRAHSSSSQKAIKTVFVCERCKTSWRKLWWLWLRKSYRHLMYLKRLQNTFIYLLLLRDLFVTYPSIYPVLILFPTLIFCMSWSEKY